MVLPPTCARPPHAGTLAGVLVHCCTQHFAQYGVKWSNLIAENKVAEMCARDTRSWIILCYYGVWIWAQMS